MQILTGNSSGQGTMRVGRIAAEFDTEIGNRDYYGIGAVVLKHDRPEVYCGFIQKNYSHLLQKGGQVVDSYRAMSVFPQQMVIHQVDSMAIGQEILKNGRIRLDDYNTISSGAAKRTLEERAKAIDPNDKNLGLGLDVEEGKLFMESLMQDSLVPDPVYCANMYKKSRHLTYQDILNVSNEISRDSLKQFFLGEEMPASTVGRIFAALRHARHGTAHKKKPGRKRIDVREVFGPDFTYERVGSEIANARQNLGLSQRELAAMLGLSSTTIYSAERKPDEMNAVTLKSIYNHLAAGLRAK